MAARDGAGGAASNEKPGRADGGYQGPEFQSAVKRILARVNLEIVKRSDQPTGFVALPKRWIVERTFAWLRPLPTTGQGLGMPQSQGARLPAPRLHPPHAAKTMQSRMMFSDKLSKRQNSKRKFS